MGRGRRNRQRKASSRKAMEDGDNNDTSADVTRKSSRKVVLANKQGNITRVTPTPTPNKMIDLSLSSSDEDDVEKKPIPRSFSAIDSARKSRSGKKRTRSSSNGSTEREPLPSAKVTTPAASSKKRGKSRTRIPSRVDVTCDSTPVSKKKLKMSEEKSRENETLPILDVFSMSDAKLNELDLGSPKYDGDNLPPCWHFDTFKLFGRDMSGSYMCKFTDFARKFCDHVEIVQWIDSPVSDLKEYDSIRDPIRPLLYRSSNLKEITLRDVATPVLCEFLTRMIAARQQGHLKNLEVFKISSLLGTGWMDDMELALLTVSKIPLREVQISDCSVQEDECGSLERLLKANKDCLKSFELHGGCPIKLGELGEQLVVVVPAMHKLEHLSFRVQFSGKKDDDLAKDIKPFRESDWAPKEVPQNMTNFAHKLKFKLELSSQLPQLKSLVLGNGVEVNNLLFSAVKSLETFHCGGSWHLFIKFPPEENRTVFRDSRVKSLQLPDALGDPSYIPQFARYFPNVRKLTVNLPSVAVLRSIFLHFGSAKLEELILRTQYDFDTVLDSALFPHLQLTQNETTRKKVKTLKAYRLAEQFVESKKVELPGQAVDPTAKGIDNFRNLKRLHLQHIPRVLQIPLNGNGKKLKRMENHYLQCSSSEEITLSKKTIKRLLQLVEKDHLTFEGITVPDISSRDIDDADDEDDPISGDSATSSDED